MTTEISEKTKIPLAWAIGIVISLTGGVGAAAVDQYKINDLDSRFSRAERQKEKHDDEDNRRDLQLSHLNDKLESIDDTLKDIKEQLKESQDRIHR